MKKAKPTIGAHQVMEALAAKHREDVFVDECKDGPTHSGSHSRLDAWAMKKSWSSPLVVGYEVKVSRSDFLQDNKWRAYLPMCNELYFAAPKGLISENEVGAEAGLMELLGGRLITRKRAPYREVVIPEAVYRYILMCRVTVQRPGYFNSDTGSRDELKRWLEQKAEDRELGRSVSRGVREYVAKVECENHRLKRLMEGYDDVRRTMASLGMNPEYRADGWTVRKKLEAAKAIIPEDFQNQLECVKDAVAGMLEQIQSLQSKT